MDWFWDTIEKAANLRDAAKLVAIMSIAAAWLLKAMRGRRESEELDYQIKRTRNIAYVDRMFSKLRQEGAIRASWRMDGTGALRYIGTNKEISEEEVENQKALRFLLRYGIVEPSPSAHSPHHPIQNESIYFLTPWGWKLAEEHNKRYHSTSN